VVGLALAASAAALVAALLSAATATTLVWATAAEVARGHPVEAEELVAVEVSASAAERLVAATTASRDELIGRVWAVDLPAHGCVRLYDGDQDVLWPEVPLGERIAVYP
jgi:AMMECR1 domain-containing protein